jgi:hypothetical protein
MSTHVNAIQHDVLSFGCWSFLLHNSNLNFKFDKKFKKFQELISNQRLIFFAFNVNFSA